MSRGEFCKEKPYEVKGRRHGYPQKKKSSPGGLTLGTSIFPEISGVKTEEEKKEEENFRKEDYWTTTLGAASGFP